MKPIIPVARAGGAPGPDLSKKRPLNPCDWIVGFLAAPGAAFCAKAGVASTARLKLKSARRFMIVLHFLRDGDGVDQSFTARTVPRFRAQGSARAQADKRRKSSTPLPERVAPLRRRSPAATCEDQREQHTRGALASSCSGRGRAVARSRLG